MADKGGGTKRNGSVLIVGGGVCGIQAALDLAEMGHKVYLVEKNGSLGGHMAQLDKTFPTLDCSACILTPKMVDVARNSNIHILTCAELLQITGKAGSFRAKILLKPRYVDLEKCTGCGECEKVCPVELKDEFNLGLSTRKAIYRPFPQAVPNAFLIDKRGTPNCRVACPAHVNVQGYVALVRQRKYREALSLIRRELPLPAVCGRVCFHPCEDKCERGSYDEPVAICALKRFITEKCFDSYFEDLIYPTQSRDERIAIIGSGPAGLTAAWKLASLGYKVTVFEALPSVGGMLRCGIPSYRLPRNVLNMDVEYIVKLGVEIKTGVALGRDFTLDDLWKDGYNAVLLAIGAQKGVRLRVEGADLEGVWDALEFLRRVNLGEEVSIGEKVAVIGGGNVAVDAARCALRLGAREVYILYRRSREEMPAYRHEVEEAEKEGVKIQFLTSPLKMLGENGKVKGIECIRMRLGELDESGRRRPIPIPGSNFLIEADTVIQAVGQRLDTSLLPEGLEYTENGTIKVDPVTLETSLPGVFACGDAVSGPSTVIDAVAMGKEAAESIDRYLRGVDLRENREFKFKVVEEVPKEDVEHIPRLSMPKLPVEKRIRNFSEVELGFTEDMAIREAERCLSCGGCSECLQCEEACEAEAIIHQQEEKVMDVDVNAVIIATGFDVFDPKIKSEYEYGKYMDVITGLEFERLINAAGPTRGELLRPSNGEVPKKVAFIQCVGSRDEKSSNLNCSRVCCMYAIKQAILIKEHYPDTEVYIFYIDIRAYGKGFEEFYQRAIEEFNIKFIRGIVSEVVENPKTQRLIVKAEDSDRGVLLQEEFDMVILSVGLTPNRESEALVKAVGLPRAPDGFFQSVSPEESSVVTPIPGIFIAGAAEGPKDIPDSIAQASAAAMKAAIVIANHGGKSNE